MCITQVDLQLEGLHHEIKRLTNMVLAADECSDDLRIDDFVLLFNIVGDSYNIIVLLVMRVHLDQAGIDERAFELIFLVDLIGFFHHIQR